MRRGLRMGIEEGVDGRLCRWPDRIMDYDRIGVTSGELPARVGGSNEVNAVTFQLMILDVSSVVDWQNMK